MAWMIKAGKVEEGAAGSASTLSIVSTPKGQYGWHFSAGRHPQFAAHAGKQVWQDVLAQLTAEL
jgi:hypothetical protein